MKNTHVTPSRSGSAPATGAGHPKVNMPANNNGTFPVSLGTTHNSKFGQGVKPMAAQGGSNQPKGSKANMPANNTTNNGPKLGTTHHAVGEVPGYLKHKN